jgi:hypothetical protein
VTPPLRLLANGGFQIVKSWIEPQVLRTSLLFWDRLVYPSSTTFRFDGGPDIEFLEQIGVLSRPTYGRADDFMGENLPSSYPRACIAAFDDLDRREPGCWALAQGEGYLDIFTDLARQGRGALVDLYRAIPVPVEDVPLAEILEFKKRRSDELGALREQVSMFYQSIQNSADRNHEMQQCIAAIDRSCADLLKVSKESGMRMRLGDLKVSFDLTEITFAAIKGFGIGAAVGMPNTSALLSGLGLAATSVIKLEADVGVRSQDWRASPYRYVYRYHDEIFN